MANNKRMIIAVCLLENGSKERKGRAFRATLFYSAFCTHRRQCVCASGSTERLDEFFFSEFEKMMMMHVDVTVHTAVILRPVVFPAH